MDCGTGAGVMDFLLPDGTPFPYGQQMNALSGTVYKRVLELEAEWIDSVMKQEMPSLFYSLAHYGPRQQAVFAAWLKREGYRMEIHPDKRRIMQGDRVVAEMRVEFTQ